MRKSPRPELLLAVEVERAVVGRDELEVVLDEARPQVVPVVLRAERRRADELGALEPVAQVVERQEQVLRAGLGEGLRAAVARRADLVERVARREVDDVDRHAGRLGQADDAVRRLALEDRRSARAPWPIGSVVPAATVCAATTSMAIPFSACIMISPPFLRGLLHRPEDRPVVAVEDARVGGEQLEVGHALGDQRSISASVSSLTSLMIMWKP